MSEPNGFGVVTNSFANAKSARVGVSITGNSGGESFAGQTVTVTLNGKTYTGTIASNGAWTVSIGAADVAALTDDESYAVTAIAIDKSGNASTTSNVRVDEGTALYVSPRDRNEVELTQIWETLFDLPRVGVKDDFFQLGGTG